MSDKKILVLPGDGIGVEVMNEVLNIINWMAKNSTFVKIQYCVGDIDFPWQLESAKWWIKKYLKQ